MHRSFVLLLAAIALASCARTETRSNAAPADVAQIAPRGVLRVAVGVGPSASAFWATRDPTTGRAQGVTVELGKAAAANLGVPLQLVEYPNSGEIMKAVSLDAWDVSFMPQDAEREKYVDQGPAYVVYESSYLVRAGSDIRNTAAIDREGVKVAAVDGTSTSRTVAKSLKHAKLTTYAKAEDAMDELAQGYADALAMGRDALTDFARKHPGTRLLDEVIQSTGVGIVVPKNRPALRAWAARFMEQAKADGTVRRALDGAGFAGATVAPPQHP